MRFLRPLSTWSEIVAHEACNQLRLMPTMWHVYFWESGTQFVFGLCRAMSISGSEICLHSLSLAEAGRRQTAGGACLGLQSSVLPGWREASQAHRTQCLANGAERERGCQQAGVQ